MLILIRIFELVRHWDERRLGSALTIRCLRKELPDSLPDLGEQEVNELCDHVRRRTPEIAQVDESWSQDVPSIPHLNWAASVLAAFEAIRPLMADDDAAIELLARANLRGWESWISRRLLKYLPKALLSHQKRPDRVMNALLSQYGFPWHWRGNRREGGGFDVTISRCFYHAFMTSHGHPKLATAFCRIDSAWFDQLDPDKLGFRFERAEYTTLANGDESCRFPIVPVTISARQQP